jgi:site-specific DNA-cytosine methylase
LKGHTHVIKKYYDLWGEMLRAVQEIKPKYVIAENVFGITNIDGGMVFEQVCLDLETEGYEVQPFIIPAAAKNAPHRRDRAGLLELGILPTPAQVQMNSRGKNQNGFGGGLAHWITKRTKKNDRTEKNKQIGADGKNISGKIRIWAKIPNSIPDLWRR